MFNHYLLYEDLLLYILIKDPQRSHSWESKLLHHDPSLFFCFLIHSDLSYSASPEGGNLSHSLCSHILTSISVWYVMLALTALPFCLPSPHLTVAEVLQTANKDRNIYCA